MREREELQRVRLRDHELKNDMDRSRTICRIKVVVGGGKKDV